MRQPSKLWPATSMGRWAVRSAGLLVLGLASMMTAVAFGQRGGDALWDNWWLGVPALVGGSGGLAALAAGTVAMVRDHDRSVAVILATAIGALVGIFLLGEAFGPH